MTPEQLNTRICEILDEKKATDITILKVTHLTVLTDNFIIATARSNTQVKALADNLEFKLSKEGVEANHIDGLKEGRWVVFDYGTTIVHIFNDETRMMYCLEKLWSDGNNMTKYKSK